jgi:hypothetical protein
MKDNILSSPSSKQSKPSKFELQRETIDEPRGCHQRAQEIYTSQAKIIILLA